jgi:hypothetical protein
MVADPRPQFRHHRANVCGRVFCGVQARQQLALELRQIDAGHVAVGDNPAVADKDILDILGADATEQQIKRGNIGLNEVFREPIPIEN